MKNLLFIYNPHAGKGRITDHLAEWTGLFQAQGFLPTLYATQGRGDGVWAASALAGSFDHVVCCGGDGTLSEVVTGLYSAKRTDIPLGYIPAGTTNDFSKTLELPVDDWEQAAVCAVAGRPRKCDVGIVNEGHLFTYVAAFGVFTQTSYDTPQPMKNLFGHTAYILKGIGSLTSLRTYRMKVSWEGGAMEDDFIFGMVSNSVSVGGFRGVVSDRVILDDGLFEVLLVRAPKSLADLNQIAAALISHQPNEHLIALQAAAIRFEGNESVAWTLDGEFGGEHQKLVVENLPRCITILCGEAQREQGR